MVKSASKTGVADPKKSTDSGIDITPHLTQFRALGAQACLDRQIPVKAVEAMKESGFIRALLPKKVGGA